MLYGYKELQNFLKKLGLNPTSAGNYRKYNLGKKGLENVQQIQKKLDIPLDIPSEISELIIDEFTEVSYDVDERNLFVTIRALCWFSSNAEMPSDKEILDFIRDAKERYGKLL